MARSKKERIKKIRDLPDIPGGPFWRLLGPVGPTVPIIPRISKELAVQMITHEESLKRSLTQEDARALLALAQERLISEIPQAPGTPLTRTDVIDDIPKRKKRKVSDYSKQFGIILKALKKKHPRTPVTRLMKRAHTATKKKMKTPGKGKLSKGRRTIAKSGQFRRDKILPRKR